MPKPRIPYLRGKYRISPAAVKTIARATINRARDEDCDGEGFCLSGGALLVKDHVQTAELMAISTAAVNE
ncbi:MAG: hypothetical protein WAN18_22130 [Candidatus Sulfotelmatobacter sp.]|jgi:hypothetical protein